jgi:hypothetical protein
MILLQPVGSNVLGPLHMGLLPIVPMLLLPFVLVFFILVFPLWGAALAILGIVFLLLRGIEALLGAMGKAPANPPSAATYKALHWVLTFGGFTEKHLRSPQPR